MNRFGKAILLAAVALVTIMLLYPPWHSRMTTGRETTDIHRGYRFLTSPPPGGGRIDYARYLGAVGVVCALATLALLETRRPSRPNDEDFRGPSRRKSPE
ncbi:MAG: hypothetical protein C4574_02400 [Candidatus Latescibacterota bacterium]|jgi:hypothetical protein|nr:MAG: hypothetical protein C4574_02400 [Candidatus Latescibacterota bacterium]